MATRSKRTSCVLSVGKARLLEIVACCLYWPSCREEFFSAACGAEGSNPLHNFSGEHRVTNGREQVCSATKLGDAPLVRGAPNLSMTSVSKHYAHTSRLATYTTWLHTDLY